MNVQIEFEKLDELSYPYIEYFSENILEHYITLNTEDKIKEVTKFNIHINSKLEKYVTLPKGKNYEGFRLQEVAAKVGLELEGRLEYILEDGSFQVFKFRIPNVSYIYLPSTFNVYRLYDVSTYIQTAFFEKISDNRFYLSCLVVGIVNV